MEIRNILHKGLLSLAILAVSVAPALAEGTFSHPTIGSDPHGKTEGDNSHHQSSEGMSGEHGRSRSHQSFSGHSSFSGHGKSGPFSEKGIKRKLHLDEEQSKKMHHLFVDYRKGTILKRANLRIAQIELDESIGGGDFDMSVIENKAKQKESAATELTMVRVQALAKAKTFLSEDQFKRFIGLVAHQGGRHGKKGSKHHTSKRKSKHHGGGSMGGSSHGGFNGGGFSDSEGY